jgi:tripartite-type tricarboxylate transporter receptor subunit TctC
MNWEIIMTEFCLKIATAAIAAVTLTVVPAAAFPDKEVTMIVNAGAGGSTSGGARILAKAMEAQLGKPIVVVAKPGGSGTKGAVLVMKAKPDGYTIGYSFSHNLAFSGQYKRKKKLFTIESFDFIGSITDPRLSIVSMAGRGWTTLGGMVKKLKAKGLPVRLVYSGGPGRLIGNAIKQDFGIDVKIIRVRGGGKSMQRVLGGHVDVVYTGGAHTPYTDAGKTIVVASVDEERNPDYPKTPTFKEMGGKASTTSLQLVYGPKGLSKAAKDKLSAAVTAASKDANVDKLFRKNLKMRILNLKGSALMGYMKREQDLYTNLIAKYDE